MSIDGLPIHPLVVHAAVMLTPVAALLAIVYAAVPRWRRLLRHPLALAALGAAGAVEVAFLSGRAFIEDVPALADAVDVHAVWGERLLWCAWVLAVVSVLAWWALPVPGGRGGKGAAVDVAVRVALVVAALVVLVVVVRTGHSGSTAVWGGILGQ
ncbi:DUF2231 domain-containing protein [Nocardioides cavernaquae]|uniref:DUF2231 domain-containing protein n=1 Tax=Nocardioides cavernaquae TaxID=2321396 RepID=A0A3A5H8V5_9ACTN|nr:DUF2231 domain-containing protein [Nocardioides cavernaquae]RJS46852.1 hypothetical protein D4739_11930 [Nocardioides cavernaquae]